MIQNVISHENLNEVAPGEYLKFQRKECHRTYNFPIAKDRILRLCLAFDDACNNEPTRSSLPLDPLDMNEGALWPTKPRDCIFSILEWI
jgi:hypothetical protein